MMAQINDCTPKKVILFGIVFKPNCIATQLDFRFIISKLEGVQSPDGIKLCAVHLRIEMLGIARNLRET